MWERERTSLSNKDKCVRERRGKFSKSVCELCKKEGELCYQKRLSLWEKEGDVYVK